MLLLAAVLVVTLTSLGGAATTTVPRGFKVVKSIRLLPGVTHVRMAAKQQDIHVARIQPGAAARLRVAVARSGIGPSHGRQPTSTMCRRTDCLVAVNGDFYQANGRPNGATVVNGEPWITRRYDRPHLIVKSDGSMEVGRFDVPISLRALYPKPLEPIDDTTGRNDFRDDRVVMAVDGVNAERSPNALIVYTRRYGARTGTGKAGVDIIARFHSKPNRLLLQKTSIITLHRAREDGNARIPDDGIVLSGRGRSAELLRQLWKDVRSGAARERIQVEVRGPAADQVLGGRPVLVRNGQTVEQDRTSFSVGRHPRTVVGWTADGTVLLVTIDGRQRDAAGMSLDEAARFMVRLGALHALNLDGGGSTTFVRKGSVRNDPSDGSERWVASALVLQAA